MNLNFSKSFTLSGGPSWSIGSNREPQSYGNIVSIRIIGEAVGSGADESAGLHSTGVCVEADFDMTLYVCSTFRLPRLYIDSLFMPAYFNSWSILVLICIGT